MRATLTRHAQRADADARKEIARHERKTRVIQNAQENASFGEIIDTLESASLAVEGLEQCQVFPEKAGNRTSSAAKSGAVPTGYESGQLAEIVQAWDSLPHLVKTSILAIVRSHLKA